MSAHNGPPCGHTLLGTCAGCGGRAPMERYDGWTAQPNATRTYAPVTVSAEAMAAAQRSIDHVQRLHERNEARLRTLLMQPSVFIEPPLKYEPEAADHIEARVRYMAIGPTLKGTFYVPPVPAPPVDPLDVEYNGVKLRKLLELDWRNRREMNETYSVLDPAQRAAVSAYWSGRLRAKVAASAAADKARETSVVVDLEEP